MFVRDKAKELWEWLHDLEAIKYDHCERLKRQRYEVSEQMVYYFVHTSKTTIENFYIDFMEHTVSVEEVNTFFRFLDT